MESIYHADSEKHHSAYLKMNAIKVAGDGCWKNDVIADVSKNSKTTQTNSFFVKFNRGPFNDQLDRFPLELKLLNIKYGVFMTSHKP